MTYVFWMQRRVPLKPKLARAANRVASNDAKHQVSDNQHIFKRWYRVLLVSSN